MKGTGRWRLTLWIFCLFLATGGLFAQERDYVLVLNSVHVDDMWTDYFDVELRKHFRQGNDVDLKIFALPAALVKDRGDTDKVRRDILAQGNRPPAAVIAVETLAWTVSAPLFENEWKDVPVILCTSSSRVANSLEVLSDELPLTDENSVPTIELSKRYNLTILENPIYWEETFNLMRRLQPEMKKVAFISDARYISAYARMEFIEQLHKYGPSLEFELLSRSDEMDAQMLMDKLDTYDQTVGILFYSWVRLSESSETYFWPKHLNRSLSVSAHSPVFILNDINPDNGTFVGGYYISVESFARSCMKILRRILSGERASSIPRSAGGKPSTQLNYAELRWHGIDPSLYPKGAYYYGRPQTFMEQYGTEVYLFASFAIIVVLMWGWYSQGSRRRKRFSWRVINALNYPVYLANRDGLVVERLNNPKMSYIILAPGSVHNLSLKELFTETEQYEEYLRVINEVITSKTTEEITVRMNNYLNEERMLFLRVVYYDDFHVMLFTSDITDQEKERRKSEEYRFFLETILENLPIPVMVKDVNDDGRIIVWNRSLAETLGVPTSVVRNRCNSDLPPSIQQVIDFGEESRQLLLNESVAYLREMECANGDAKIMSVYNTFVSFGEEKRWLVVSAIDITEEHKHKIELEMLNRRYDLTLKTIGAMPWTWNLETGMLECDRSYMSSKYGITRNLIGKTEQEHYEQMDSDHRERVKAEFDKLRRDEVALIDVEYPVYYAEYASYLWVETFSAVARRDDEGRPNLLVGATSIINERKQMEQELFRAKEKAEEANKMKSAFLANMTHEIRTPLNAIIGFSSLLVNMNSDPDSKQFGRIIEHNNRILLQLINDVLDISKMESGMMEFKYGNMDVNVLLSSLVSSWVPRVPEGVQLRFEPALDQCILYTDDAHLTQVIGNYLSNAAKHTTEGSIIVGYYPSSEGNIRFFVRDTGEGIPEDKLTAVFERFVKVDSFKQGTGLGLSICSMIAEHMHGKVGVKSELGKGSEFWFEIPYHPGSMSKL